MRDVYKSPSLLETEFQIKAHMEEERKRFLGIILLIYNLIKNSIILKLTMSRKSDLIRKKRAIPGSVSYSRCVIRLRAQTVHSWGDIQIWKT